MTRQRCVVWGAKGALVALLFLLAGCEVLLPKRSLGEKLYRRHCAECHGVDGSGNTPRYMNNHWADLTNAGWKYGGDRVAVENVIRQGIFAKMPAQEDLSDEEIRALVEHVFQLGKR
jgi:mono/diheme cytochrome c family protein